MWELDVIVHRQKRVQETYRLDKVKYIVGKTAYYFHSKAAVEGAREKEEGNLRLTRRTNKIN